MSGGTILGLWTRPGANLWAALRTSAVRGHYTNPILPGNHPDAGAIRVGSDYYLTNTSPFSYTPGLVIWHSRNLADWTAIGAALHSYIGDVWAPYLCQHQEQFLIYFPISGHMFVVHAATPEGPWSEPIDLKVRGIDPAHVVAPDGRRFLYMAGGQMIEPAADGLSTKGTPRKAFGPWPIPESWRVECGWLEARKVFQKGWLLLSDRGGGRHIRTSDQPYGHLDAEQRPGRSLGVVSLQTICTPRRRKITGGRLGMEGWLRQRIMVDDLPCL